TDVLPRPAPHARGWDLPRLILSPSRAGSARAGGLVCRAVGTEARVRAGCARSGDGVALTLVWAYDRRYARISECCLRRDPARCVTRPKAEPNAGPKVELARSPA